MFSNVRGNKTLLLRTLWGYVPDAKEHVSRESNNVVSHTLPDRMPDSAAPRDEPVVSQATNIHNRPELYNPQIPEWRRAGQSGGMISELKAKTQLDDWNFKTSRAF